MAAAADRGGTFENWQKSCPITLCHMNFSFHGPLQTQIQPDIYYTRSRIEQQAFHGKNIRIISKADQLEQDSVISFPENKMLPRRENDFENVCRQNLENP